MTRRIALRLRNAVIAPSDFIAHACERMMSLARQCVIVTEAEPDGFLFERAPLAGAIQGPGSSG